MRTSNEFKSQFDDYINTETLETITSRIDNKKGAFIPYCGIIVLDCTLAQLKDEFKKKDAVFSDKPSSDSELLHRTLYHETIHSYHLMGSSLGALLKISASYCSSALIDYFDKYPFPPDMSFKKYKEIRKYDVNEDLVTLWKWTNLIINLFTSTNRSLYLPQIKDYSAAIYETMELYCSMYKEHTGKEINFDNFVQPLLKELVLSGDLYPFISLLAPAEKELINDWKKHYCFNSKINAVCLSEHAIIEGYAKLYELFTLDKHIFESNLKGVSSESINLMLLNKLEGIYSVTITQMFEDLNWIIDERGTDEYINTCFSIYELSLMTRFHPYLLFENENISLSELLIPMRFAKLHDFFSENRFSISDFCFSNSSSKMLDGLDRLCHRLGWLKYSDCLKSVYALHDRPLFKNPYYSQYSRYIIEKKLEGNLFGPNFRADPELKHPAIIFNDGMMYSMMYNSSNEENKNKFGQQLIDATHDLVYYIYGFEMFTQDNLDRTKHWLRKFASFDCIDKKNFEQYVKSDLYPLFIDPNEILQ